jgi:hypothetical protein
MLTHLTYLNQKFNTGTQTHATMSVTAPEADGGIRCCTSLNQALVSAPAESILSAIISQTERSGKN